MGWEYSIKIGGYTYNYGDIVFVKGQGYASAYAGSAVGITYGDNYRTRFYGVYSASGVIDYPICVGESPDGTSPTANYFIKPDQIVSGGTPDTHTYSFDANGGYDAPSAMIKIYGEHFTFPSEKPKRTGYTFIGWNNGSVNNGKTYVAGETVVGLPDENIIWWAIWKANTYTVYFNAGGGSVSPTSKTVTYALTYGTLPTPSKSGHTFNGWFTSASGGTRITSGSTVSITSDITLYAQWSVNDYVLTVNPNGGTWNSSTSKQTFTQKYGTTKAISNPTRVGYNFAGWKLNGYGSFSGQTYTYGAGNGELVAQWNRIVLTVTFDASTNGGSQNSTRNVYYGDTIGSLPVPSKPFYKFIGWFTKAVGGTQISANNVITSNVTFYAQYKIDASVKVKYNGNNLPAIVWVKVNGVWKKCITWIKDNGKWNKSTGAD